MEILTSIRESLLYRIYEPGAADAISEEVTGTCSWRCFTCLTFAAVGLQFLLASLHCTRLWFLTRQCCNHFLCVGLDFIRWKSRRRPPDFPLLDVFYLFLIGLRMLRTQILVCRLKDLDGVWKRAYGYFQMVCSSMGLLIVTEEVCFIAGKRTLRV